MSADCCEQWGWRSPQQRPGNDPVPWMRHSVTPPALTASSKPDVAVVTSSSVTPEPARASRERPKDFEDVILVKFVLLVSVYTTSVNGAQFSEASKFQVLLCLNVLQVLVLMESRHKDFWSRHSDSQIIPHMFSCSCFKVVWLRGHHHGLPHLFCSLRQGQPQCLFPIHDQILVSQQQWGSWWTAKTGEGGHGGQLQNCHSCVEMTVGCGFTACKYMIVLRVVDL